MRGLIDTSTFLWFITGDPRLSRTAKAFIAETDNEIFLSIVSLWEFDRLIISQGIAENLPILTSDRLFSAYAIEKIW